MRGEWALCCILAHQIKHFVDARFVTSSCDRERGVGGVVGGGVPVQPSACPRLPVRPLLALAPRSMFVEEEPRAERLGDSSQSCSCIPRPRQAAGSTWRGQAGQEPGSPRCPVHTEA